MLAIAAGGGALLPGAVASADQISQNAIGTYTWARGVGKEPIAKWVMTPCADNTPKCVRVSQYGLSDTAMTRPSITGNAYWTVGSWVMVADVPKAVICEDGTATTLAVTFAWDAATGEGSRSFTDPGLCGKKPGVRSIPMYVTKIDSATPAPAPPIAPVPAAAPAPPAPPAPGAAEAPAAPPPAA